MRRSYAYELIEAASIVSGLSGIPDIETLPSNPAQARPLTSLPIEQQREAWIEFVGNFRQATRLRPRKLPQILSRLNRLCGSISKSKAFILAYNRSLPPCPINRSGGFLTRSGYTQAGVIQPLTAI